MNNRKSLSEKTTDSNPFSQFARWYSERLSSGVSIPDAVALGTSSIEGSVSLRTVLLKSYNEKGFIFFTNYNSRKGNELLLNPKAALLFYWPESARQVRIEGTTEKISGRESEDYFMTRPYESRISAWASEQSQPVPDREFLEKKAGRIRDKYENQDIPKPPFWGGFRLIPSGFEFWQEGEHRLHDRIIYYLRENEWYRERLAP